MRRKFVFTLLILVLGSVFSLNPVYGNSGRVRSVVIFVHGIFSGPNAYSDFIDATFHSQTPTSWRTDLSDTKMLQLNWGATLFFSTAVGNRCPVSPFRMNDWQAAAKLKEMVAQVRTLFGQDTPITLITHSQGTIVTLAALQEGMTVTNWVLMGSPLDQNTVRRGDNNTRFITAAGQVSSQIVNLWSTHDGYVNNFNVHGIGGNGLYKDNGKVVIDLYDGDKILDVQIGKVNHFNFSGLLDSVYSGWWEAEWMTDTLGHAWPDGYTPEFLVKMMRGAREAQDYNGDVMASFDSLEIFARDSAAMPSLPQCPP